MHCISEYPAPPENTNLKAMINLNKKFLLPIGLSDHSTQREIPLAAAAMGSGVKKPNSTEMKNKNFIRGSLVASKKISIGEKFTWNNIAVKRPGDGLNPRYLFDIIGKKSKHNFLENDQIKK